MNDRTRITMRVSAPRELAFFIFTEQMDTWWRHGKKFRSGERSTIALEPKLGGKLTETMLAKNGTLETMHRGDVLIWEPPARLVFSWRGRNFTVDDPATEVEVQFERAIGHSGEGTLVTLEHRGWSRVRDDHPVRHGRDAHTFMVSMGLWWSDLLGSLREHVATSETRDAGSS